MSFCYTQYYLLGGLSGTDADEKSQPWVKLEEPVIANLWFIPQFWSLLCNHLSHCTCTWVNQGHSFRLTPILVKLHLWWPRPSNSLAGKRSIPFHSWFRDSILKTSLCPHQLIWQWWMAWCWFMIEDSQKVKHQLTWLMFRMFRLCSNLNALITLSRNTTSVVVLNTHLSD